MKDSEYVKKLIRRLMIKKIFIKIKIIGENMKDSEYVKKLIRRLMIKKILPNYKIGKDK